MAKETNLERLSKEKFNDKGLEWKVSKNMDPSLRYVEDNEAWYSNKIGTDIVYVQPKSPSNAKARCYNCNTLLLITSAPATSWDRYGPGPCAGNSTTNYSGPYCPKCEKEPVVSSILIE